ncbi:hypothetical protein [Moraxella bovis]|uniref:Uncharacterized protein n=1 Tax=Moraxella bovis TaxID=476 RepID=A0A378PY91_MORBO|nr:hypothetical protein [Moraxella bovis]UYZ74499.1 hypothetical protein LP093_06815 [Moraxella bovis]UYZ79826.1 hypothetical protein LP113_07075 [Moraxella bovis]UYZ90785.1 hypothetical protein LP114_06915 [Moraxella bovis]UYZ93461.1 hypothetical protein LP103_06945 [Moraxella bovis]UYZ94020.1 hypothetical protein LP121_08985 [Moraxella bovis]
MIIHENAQIIMFTALSQAIKRLDVKDGDMLLASMSVDVQVTDRLTITAHSTGALATGTPSVVELVGDNGILMSFDEFGLGAVIMGGDVAIDEFVLDF